MDLTKKIYKVLAAVGVVLLICPFLSSAQVKEERPNMVFVLADDLAEEDLKQLPELQEIMGGAGTTFDNAYVTYPLCCPSRASILRGQYPHNHQILSNTPPMGGHDKFRDTGLDRSTFATWLDDAGYRTAYIGKYLNRYGKTDPKYVPPGWDEWFAVSGESEDDQYNDNGVALEDGGHSADLFADKAADFIRRASANPEPFFAFVGTKAPHAPPEVADRYEDAFAQVSLPRPESFNEEDVSDKPRWVREYGMLEDRRIASLERAYRERLASMLSVVDLLRKTIATLEETGELDNTYVFFASDNGYHLGQHRLARGKVTPYEEDISIPLMVRGPGVPAGRVLPQLVINNDLAPTFADLAGVPAPEFVDGRSIKPLLAEARPSEWRTAFLAEGWTIDSKIMSIPRVPNYKALHTRDHVFVSYETRERELYHLPTDPYQLESKPYASNESLYQSLAERLERLRDCAGNDCRTAEDR